MKDLKISKELIEEVMKDKGTFETININKNELSTFGVLGHHIFSINIYEFTFKCKEWITSKDYYLSTFIDFGVDNYFCEIKWFNSEHIIQNKNFIADTELEVIFKACEWILSGVNK